MLGRYLEDGRGLGCRHTPMSSQVTRKREACLFSLVTVPRGKGRCGSRNGLNLPLIWDYLRKEFWTGLGIKKTWVLFLGI